MGSFAMASRSHCTPQSLILTMLGTNGPIQQANPKMETETVEPFPDGDGREVDEVLLCRSHCKKHHQQTLKMD